MNASRPSRVRFGDRIRAKAGGSPLDSVWGKGWTAAVGGGAEGTLVPDQSSFLASCLYAPSDSSLVGDVERVAACDVRVSTKVADAAGEHPALYKGDKVVRGPSWKWGDEDGGDGNTGSVLSKTSLPGWVMVAWGKDPSRTFHYRYMRAGENLIDLSLAQR